MKFLAIDQSTSSTSAFVFDTKGGVQKLFASPHRQIRSHPGWVEHDPGEILAHVTAALDAGLAAGADAFALCNQGESCLAWDGDTGTPLGPIIVWQDARTTAWCETLEKQATDVVRQKARLPVDPYFSASKLGWIMRHIPQAQPLAATGRLRLGTTDAFFRDRLTGRFETDIATASRTSLLHVETGQWDPALCEIFGVPIHCLPRITDCSGQLGTAQGLPLAAAIVDQQAALYGHGIQTPGQTKFTFGTGAFAQTLTGQTCPPLANGVLPTVAWREAGQNTVFALDGGIQTAGSAVDWAQRLGLFDSHGQLDGYSGHALARGLAFVPALAGLACPHWNNTAKGAWLGLSLETTPQDMMQALFEGIAYRAREICDAMHRTQRLDQPLLVDGGMTQNPWFCQVLANVTERKLKVSHMPDITAFGAARMAANYAKMALPYPTSQSEIRPDGRFTPMPDRFAEACKIAAVWASPKA